MAAGAVHRVNIGPQADEAVTSPNGRPMIQLEGVRKSFGDNLVLDGIDLEVASGEVLAKAEETKHREFGIWAEQSVSL